MAEREQFDHYAIDAAHMLAIVSEGEESIRWKWTVARCLRALGRYDEAFAIQQDLIQYPEQGYVSEELGELLLVFGRPEEARFRFNRAYELLAQRLGSDQSQAARLARLKALGFQRFEDREVRHKF